MGWMFDIVGRLIARLQQPASNSEPFTPNDSTALRDTLRPGDVLLVEGKGRISSSIKYLTQSTWSHAALYVGPMAGAATGGEPHVLIEANIDEGVVSAPLSKYLHCQTRICRPMGLSEADCEEVCRYASERIETRPRVRIPQAKPPAGGIKAEDCHALLYVGACNS